MASGNIYTTFHGGYKLNVEWNSTTSEISNSSVITAKITLVCSTGYGLSIGSKANTLTINGTTYNFTSPSISTGGGTTINLGTVTSNSINHNGDGTKSVNISCDFNIKATLSNIYYDAITASGTVTLDNIVRKATITSAPNFNENSKPTITYSNPAGISAASLQACIADSTGTTIFAKYRDISKVGTSYTFYLTEEERLALIKACGTSNSMTVRFYVKSIVNGEVYYSFLAKTMTVSDSNVVISAYVVDTNSVTKSLTGNENILIRYHSNASAVMTPASSAAINLDSCIIRNGGVSGYGTSYTFNNVESNTFSFTASDARGNVGSTTVTAQMIDYVRLTCNIGNEKPDTSGKMNLTCSGNYFNNNFGAASNTLTVQYRYKTQGGNFGNWINMSAVMSDNSYTATATLTGLNYQTTYIFEARAMDRLSVVTSSESSVKSVAVFHWSDSDFIFEVPVTFNAGTTGVTGGDSGAANNNITGDFSITGNLRLKGSGNYGNTIYFGDSSYACITETTDDDLTIKSSDLNLNATNLFFNNRSIKYGTWTPTLSSSAVSSYSVRQGWYQKVGSVVTIGWQVKANCSSGYSSTSISMSGLPFTPAYDASGSGVCSGAYVSAGFNFECWVASTSGTITGRVQACNNTSAANLSTSASGLFYRSGGGEITIGGTICYLTNDT